MANRKCNILVIEDDPQIRKLMATSLTAEGYGVETVQQSADHRRQRAE